MNLTNLVTVTNISKYKFAINQSKCLPYFRYNNLTIVTKKILSPRPPLLPDPCSKTSKKKPEKKKPPPRLEFENKPTCMLRRAGSWPTSVAPRSSPPRTEGVVSWLSLLGQVRTATGGSARPRRRRVQGEGVAPPVGMDDDRVSCPSWEGGGPEEFPRGEWRLVVVVVVVVLHE